MNANIYASFIFLSIFVVILIKGGYQAHISAELREGC